MAQERVEDFKKCACCGAKPAAPMKCGACKEVVYCNRDCQRKDWKQHKPNCGAMKTLMDMGGSVDPEQDDVLEAAKAHNKMIKAAKKSGMPVVCMSFTAFGIVGPGMPVPEGVPPNFALKQAATMEFQSLASYSGTTRGNFKGEASYRAYFDDIEGNKEQWMAFFDHRDNYEHAEHTCGILGTLATIYRQRGSLGDCEKVLDMEEEVLARYHRVSVGTKRAQVMCCEMLTYKYQMIRYNLCFQTKRYEMCCGLFRKLAAFELENNFPFDNQNYLFMLVAVLKKKPAASVLRALTDDEVHKCVVAPLKHNSAEEIFAMQGPQRTALQSCNKCAKKESAIAQFKKCPQCKVAHYCGKECQRVDWKEHKAACKAAAVD